MNLDLVPAPDADLKNRRDWLVYQFMRYGRFHRRLLPFLFLVNILISVVAFSQLGWWGVPLVIFCFFLTDAAYERVSFALLFKYHTQIATYIFDGKTTDDDEHKMVVLLNDLENFISNKDKKIEARLKERLVDTYEEFKKRRTTNGNPTEIKESKTS
jgi:hypothetical protein